MPKKLIATLALAAALLLGIFFLADFRPQAATVLEEERELMFEQLSAETKSQVKKLEKEENWGELFVLTNSEYPAFAALNLQNSEKMEDIKQAAGSFEFLASTDTSEQRRNYFAHSAVRNYERVLELDSTDLSSQKSLGFLYIRELNTPMKGVLLLRDVAEESPEDVEVQMILGNMSMMSGQFEKAVERFSKVLDNQPDRMDAKYQLAQALANLGSFGKATRTYEEILKKDPTNVEVYYKMAELCLSQDDSDCAIRIFERGLRNFEGNEEQRSVFRLNIQQIIDSRN